jgi:hypothetical protein
MTLTTCAAQDELTDHRPQPLIQPLEATPCRRAQLATFGTANELPDVIAYHQRLARELRQSAIRHAGRAALAWLRRVIG